MLAFDGHFIDSYIASSIILSLNTYNLIGLSARGDKRRENNLKSSMLFEVIVFLPHHPYSSSTPVCRRPARGKGCAQQTCKSVTRFPSILNGGHGIHKGDRHAC